MVINHSAIWEAAIKVQTIVPTKYSETLKV